MFLIADYVIAAHHTERLRAAEQTRRVSWHIQPQRRQGRPKLVAPILRRPLESPVPPTGDC